MMKNFKGITDIFIVIIPVIISAMGGAEIINLNFWV